MTGQIIDLLEIRQNMTVPKYPARQLLPTRDALPTSILDDLYTSYVDIYRGLTGWIGQDANGRLHNIEVVQVGPDAYEYRTLFAHSINHDGPRAA